MIPSTASGTPDTVDLSVVIPTRGRARSVARLVEDLQTQELDGANWEIIVVLDGDVDGTETTLNMLDVEVTPSIVRLPDAGSDDRKGHGAATARNAGTNRATGRIIVFVDDDIDILTDRFLAHHLASHHSEVPSLAVGSLRVDVDVPTFLSDITAQWWDRSRRRLVSGAVLSFRDVTSANLSLPAAVFRDLGGFDERLHRREDQEFGVRAQSRGIPIVAVHEAFGAHAFSTDARTYLHDVRLEGIGDALTVRAYPAVTDDLPIVAYERLGRLQTATLRIVVSPRWERLRRTLLACALSGSERLGLRRIWRIVFAAASRAEYWAGVSESVGGLRRHGQAAEASPGSSEGHH